MSATTETLAFSIGLQVSQSACSKGERVLVLARVGLDAAAKLGQYGSAMELQQARQAFQAAADVLRAELREQRRAA